MEHRPHISVCIPTYEMHGKGADFLRHNFDKLLSQTFKDFDIVISDNAKDDSIKKVCGEYKNKLTIHYFKNEDPLHGMSSNVNNTITKATGKIIKILFLDDFLYTNTALETIAKNFNLETDLWLATGCIHTTDGCTFEKIHSPNYNKYVYSGKNTIGSPSVIAIKNDSPLLFDTNLSWLMDCDYYTRYHTQFGKPKIINQPLIAIRLGEHQITNTEATKSLRAREKMYVEKKFPDGMHEAPIVELPNVTLVAVSGINPNGAINALLISMQRMTYFDVVLISHNKPEHLPPGITFKQCKPTELVSTDPKNKDDYSKFMAYNLCDYIESDFCLIVHNDAYVLRPHKWNPEFLKYDYIGAPWQKNKHFTKEGINIRVGNGGFSLRSKRMLGILNELHLSFTDSGTGFYNEDGILCVYYRHEIENAGLTFAPVDVAARFSHELDVQESVSEPFGFHNYKKTSRYRFLKNCFIRILRLFT